MKNLLEKISHCIENDEMPEESSQALKEHYEKLGKRDRLVIDQAFILMCGYKLESILTGKTIFEEEFNQ